PGASVGAIVRAEELPLRPTRPDVPSHENGDEILTLDEAEDGYRHAHGDRNPDRDDECGPLPQEEPEKVAENAVAVEWTDRKEIEYTPEPVRIRQQRQKRDEEGIARRGRNAADDQPDDRGEKEIRCRSGGADEQVLPWPRTAVVVRR